MLLVFTVLDNILFYMDMHRSDGSKADFYASSSHQDSQNTSLWRVWGLSPVALSLQVNKNRDSAWKLLNR